MVPREATTLSTNTTTDIGIMAQQNTGNENAHTNTRDEDDTPDAMQRNDTTKTKATSTLGKQGECTTRKDTTSGKKETTKETEYGKNKEKQTSRN